MQFIEIEKLIDKAQSPLDNAGLERFQLANGEGHQPYFRFLYHLVKYMGAKNCVEIGVYNGIASAHMAIAGAKVTGIDHNEVIYQHNNFNFIHGDSCKVVDQVPKNINILFQDSSHHYLPSKIEWELYSPLMARGGVWVCDDITPAFYNPNYDPNPLHIDPEGCGMVQYFDGLPGNKKLYPDVLHIGNTQGIILF